MLKNFSLFVIWFGIILYLSFTPLTNWPKSNVFDKMYFDKIVHVCMYAMLSMLLIRGFFKQQNSRLPRLNFILGSIIFCALVGISIEIFQPVLTRFRKFEVLDMVANSIGAISGYYFFRFLAMKKWLR